VGSLLLTMSQGGMVAFPGDVVVTVLVVVQTLVDVDEETSPNRGISSLLVSYVDTQIIPF
jgi:hypothetical protein